MATPLTYDQLVAALKTEGLTVQLWPGSRDRCRCHSGSHDKGIGPTGRQWGPVNGVMVHITAGTATGLDRYIANVLLDDPSLPCKVQMTVKPDGTVVVLSAGRCNHAGKIGSGAIAASVADSWPTGGWTDKRGSQVDGNAHYYGIENIATSQMTAAQRDASVRICAAISRAHGWTGQGTCGHGEASSERGYSDPGLDMGAFRRDVMARVKAGAAGKPTNLPNKPTTTKTTTQGDTTMAITDADAQKIAAAILGSKLGRQNITVAQALQNLANAPTLATTITGTGLSASQVLAQLKAAVDKGQVL